MTRSPYAIRLSWQNALVSIVATAGLWSLPWFMWPASFTAAATVQRQPPVIRYVRAAEGLDGATWSPVVFPLPTRDGFSKKAVALESGPSMVSLLPPPVSEAVFLNMEPEHVEGARVGLLTVGEEVAFRPGAIGRAAREPAAGVRAEEIQIEWDAGLASRQVEAPGLRTIQWDDALSPWLTATAYIEVDQKGFIQHVFLENSCGQTNVDGAIVRALLSGFGTKGEEAVRGRVRLNGWKNAKANGEPRK